MRKSAKQNETERNVKKIGENEQQRIVIDLDELQYFEVSPRKKNQRKTKPQDG